AQIYDGLTAAFGDFVYVRHDVHATTEEKEALRHLTPGDVSVDSMAGERVDEVLTEAPGDGMPIGGIKVVTRGGWIAVRPSGTEEVYKIYAESFIGPRHLEQLDAAARALVADVLDGRRRRNRERR